MITVTEGGYEFINMCNISKKPTLFISYNWGSEENAIKIEAALSECADIKRDKKSIKPWGNLVEFMNSIREQDFAVLIISDAYLKSVNCMYEVTQLMKDDKVKPQL